VSIKISGQAPNELAQMMPRTPGVYKKSFFFAALAALREHFLCVPA